MKEYDRLQSSKALAVIYEMDDGRARVFINEGSEEERILQYFKTGSDAFDWLYNRGFLIW